MPSARVLVGTLLLLTLVGGFPAAQGQQVVTSIQPLPAVTDSDERFGIGNVYPDPHWLNLAHDAGVRWNRWEFRWSSIEPREGSYFWSGSDLVVDTNQAARIKLQGILISTPRWAEWKTDHENSVPRGLYEPWDSPENTWGRFVRTIAERYRGRVQAWEIWNEPDYPRGSFSFWFGTKADYYQLLKVSYRAIRSVDPDAKVLMAGLMYWADPGYLEDLLAMARADPEAPANNHFFDAVAWHVYSRPTDVFERVQRSRLLLQTYVGDKAIWVNEGNLPVWTESRMNNYNRFPLSGTLEEQAAWVVQWYAYALGAGADRVLMYRMHDSDEPEAWGLARSDGSIRPAYVAYQLAARYLSHATRATRATQGDMEQIVFERPGQRVSVVWNRTPRPLAAELGAAATRAALVALDGSTQGIVPRGGVYRITLPPATADAGLHPEDYLVGGSPYILVEDLPPIAQRHEESDPLLAWSGQWQAEAQPAASGGAVRASAQPGASVSFAFDGPTVTWYTSKSPRGGIVRLTLDGAPLGEVDLYNPSPVPQHPLTYTDLGAGSHVLTITAAGARHEHALGAYLVVDAFAAEQAYAAPALAPAPEVAAARFFATVTPGPAGGVARPPAATVTPVAVSVTSPSYRAPLLVGSVPSPTAVPPTPTPASQSVVRSPDAW